MNRYDKWRNAKLKDVPREAIRFVWTRCVQYGILYVRERRMKMAHTLQKNHRMDLRVKADKKELLNYAASLQNLSLSAFVLASALKEAQAVVTEKAHFSLPAKEWKSFCARLDQPAQSIPKLKKLFSQLSVFNE
ncbi:MAG: DUF1778 domain-containing protein [Candidatus Omnitrophota bacterium]